MSNPIYEQMASKMNPGLMDQINQIKSIMKGDPNEHIQRLLNSGKVTQAQYDAAAKKAQQIMRMMGR